MQIEQYPSPNFGPRRGGLTPNLIVIHYTAMENAQAARDRLCDREAQVSAHYLIGAFGKVTQMVAEDQRAWHAGAGEWHGMDDINSRSIGIELDNRGNHPFSAPQMDSLTELLRRTMARWAIDPSGVIGHSDMAPGRKVDPGPRFDWARLVRAGLAAPSGRAQATPAADWTSFVTCARAAGYTAPAQDATLLDAVRLRHRPWARGPLEGADIAALKR